MESEIENILSEIMSAPNAIGCLFANNQGLCVGSKGKSSPEAAGLIVAISEQASKLHPNSNPPVILLETSDKQCLIHKYGITGAIYKSK